MERKYRIGTVGFGTKTHLVNEHIRAICGAGQSTKFHNFRSGDGLMTEDQESLPTCKRCLHILELGYYLPKTETETVEVTVTPEHNLQIGEEISTIGFGAIHGKVKSFVDAETVLMESRDRKTKRTYVSEQKYQNLRVVRNGRMIKVEKVEK